jgi:adenylosuccinate synthase
MSYVVLGAQFGDEGKGKLVDILSKNTDMCIKGNGGSNAGHTIVVNGVHYYMHLIPSGVIHKNVIGILGNGVVINLVALFKESAELSKLGVDIKGRLFISNKAHITLSSHKLVDEIENKAIGTTKQGIGPTYSDMARRKGIRMDDLLTDNYSDKIAKFYSELPASYQTYIQNNTIEIDSNKYTSLDELCKYDISMIKQNIDFLRTLIIDATHFVNLNNDKKMIIEGANAAMLDINFGTYPYVTSSTCTVGCVFTGIGISPKLFNQMKFQVIGVTKGYITRVGGGTLPTEISDDRGKQIQKIGGEIGVTTGRIRRCGWLDLPQLKYSCMLNGFDSLNLTKLDVLSFLDKIPVCVEYKDKNNKTITEYPSNEEELTKVIPVYVELDGWPKFDLDKCQKITDLHPNIIKFIQFIEKSIGTPIKYINTGKDRDSIIIIE